MKLDENEEKLLRSVALQNARAVLLARERAERELRESNDRISSILESISDAFIVLDKEWRFIYVNPQADKILRPPNKMGADLLGKSYWEEFPAMAGTLLEENFRRAVAEGLKVAFEFYYAPLNSSFHVRAYPSHGGLSAYFLDITDQKRAEEITNLLAAIVDSSDDAIISKNLQGIITSWNKGAERLFGHTATEAVGQHITLIIPPDRRGEEDVIISCLRRDERVDHFETIRMRKDRTLIDVSLTISPVKDSAGQVIGASKVARDITKKKQVELALLRSEERSRAIVETTPECVKVVAADGTLQHMNASGLAMVGADYPEMVIGKNIYDLIAPEDRDKFRHFNEKVCQGERGTLTFDIIGLHGLRRHMETQAAPLHNPDGTVVQLAVTRDVTERRRIEDQLRKTEKIAAAGQLAASLAHEINNPLSSVTNALYLLKRHSGHDAKAQDLVTMAVSETARMSRIVKQSLAYYRQDAAPREIELGAMVKESLAVYRDKFDRAGIQLTTKIDSGTWIVGFPDEIRQVIDNLLLNAVEAMPKGGPLGISVHPSVDWKRGYRKGVRLMILDSGCGISGQFLSKIFDPFFTTKAEKGTGLGLWVVRGLILKHHGTIRVRSSIKNGNSGTVISILWPFSDSTNGKITKSRDESIA